MVSERASRGVVDITLILPFSVIFTLGFDAPMVPPCQHIETVLVPLINEQGEKKKGRDEWEFACCSFLGSFGWRGTVRAWRAAAQGSGRQSG